MESKYVEFVEMLLNLSQVIWSDLQFHFGVHLELCLMTNPYDDTKVMLWKLLFLLPTILFIFSTECLLVSHTAMEYNIMVALPEELIHQISHVIYSSE